MLKFIPGETVQDERSIRPNSVKGNFHNPLTSRCETFNGQKLLAILSFLTNNGLSLVYVFPKKVTLLITARQNVQYDLLHRCVTLQLSLLLFRFVAFHYDMKFIAAFFFFKGFSAKQQKKPKKKEIITAL